MKKHKSMRTYVEEHMAKTLEDTIDRVVSASEDIAWYLDSVLDALGDPDAKIGEDEKKQIFSILRSLSFYFHNLKVSITAKRESLLESTIRACGIIVWSTELLRDTLRAKLGANSNAERRD
jgi:hypothetical protein